tara:strand:- start:283 stop:906 length:624 start_codon:yes stop_codon:yes gene_type:complete
MGRPINKKHIGDGAGKIQVTAVRFAAGAEVAAATETHIISQRSTKKFNVTDGTKTEVVTLVNKTPGALAASEFCINVADSAGVTKQVTKLRNRTMQVEGTANAKWARSATGTSSAVEKAITGATAANPVVITSNGHGLANGTKVSIRGVVGMVELNIETAYTVASTATNTFALTGIDGGAFTGYTSGGVVTVAAVETGGIVVDAQAS